MTYDNTIPVHVPDTTTLAELKEMAEFNGWIGYRYDARRGVLYAVTEQATRPLLNAETLLGNKPLSAFLVPQAG